MIDKLKYLIKEYVFPGFLLSLSFYTLIFIITAILEILFINPQTHSYNAGTPVFFILLFGIAYLFVPAFILTILLYFPIQKVFKKKVSKSVQEKIIWVVLLVSIILTMIYSFSLFSLYRNIQLPEFLQDIEGLTLFGIFFINIFLHNFLEQKFKINLFKYSILLVILAFMAGCVWEYMLSSGFLVE